MSTHALTFYQVTCDWPDCPAIAQDGDYAAWSDPGTAAQEAAEAGWWTSTNDVLHYCPGHPATWASEHENGEDYPDPPYLLIHDGDTSNPADDGHVTLMDQP